MLLCLDVLDMEGRYGQSGLGQATVLAAISCSNTYEITCG